jgi:hypothetical protein
VTYRHRLCSLLLFRAALQVAALVFGDESAALSQPVGYRGEHTLSMRSTKVGDSSTRVENVASAAVGLYAADTGINTVYAVMCKIVCVELWTCMCLRSTHQS